MQGKYKVPSTWKIRSKYSEIQSPKYSENKALRYLQILGPKTKVLPGGVYCRDFFLVLLRVAIFFWPPVNGTVSHYGFENVSPWGVYCIP